MSPHRSIGAALTFALALFGVVASATAQDHPNLLLTVSGTVEVSKAGQSDWSQGKTNQVLKSRDRLRTGRSSRATVQLSDLSILRINQLTTVEIQEPSASTKSKTAVLDLKSGAAYFFNRDKPMETQFRTPSASGAVRGTEFNVAVDEAGRTIVTLIDGEVELNNDLGGVTLQSGEQGIVDRGAAPRKTAALEALSVIQWTLYYSAILDPDELELPAGDRQFLAASLEAYRSGDLLRALAEYPANRTPASDSEKVFYAALLLSVGQAEEADRLLTQVSAGDSRAAALAAALRELIASVRQQPLARRGDHGLATEFLAASYAEQSRFNLDRALELARRAAIKSPGFGFAQARVAELEFGFGRTALALDALEKGLAASPRNAQALALKGFLLSAQNKIAEAQNYFDQSIALDGSLGNAWLGRGLIKIRRGQSVDGRKDLQVAAALEPNRALLRSYLGKAFSNAGDRVHAEHELDLAKKLDPNDPTAWLYLALLHQQENKINSAVSDLEKSQELNNNRSIFRSRMLLDQDRAVRSANLAAIYRDAGMTDVSIREAVKAVNADYANYSAHQFLSSAYDELRDPKQINLRYETPWLSELLVANLLAPVGAGTLSQNISQQEYSRLFEGDRIGIISKTEYFSSGDWIQNASQFGTLGNSSYALDAYYNTQNGQRPNNDLDDLFLSAKFKEQITPQDSLYLQLTYETRHSGDVLQYYDQSRASLTQRVKEDQAPNIFAGFHHEWAPGIHTLFLAGRLDDTLNIDDPSPVLLFFRQIGGVTTRVSNPSLFSLNYQRELEAYSTELQQIFEIKSHQLVVGARYQWGEADTTNNLVRVTGPVFVPEVEADLWRVSVYAYDQWKILDTLQFTAGLSYDRLHFPKNADTTPVSAGEDEKERFSPKVGFIWLPCTNTQVRGSYTRSLGGVFFDSSVRLEPTQVGGFNQAYRSVAPESVVGLVPGTEFETAAFGLDHAFPTRTYVGLEGQWLSSSAQRTVGVLNNSGFLPVPDAPGSTRQRIDYEEKSLTASINQLIGEDWSIGARYRLTYADIDGRFIDVSPAVPGAAGINQDNQATLHQLNLFAIYNLPCGFFAQGNALWNGQSNRGYSPDQPGDDFWQFDLFAGYRFPNRHAEVRLGVLNLGDRDYKLNPLTYYLELPRERIFYASIKINF
jgi:Tfp pilus assembly protein PilF